MFYLFTCIVGVSAVYKYKRMCTLRFDSLGAQNGGRSCILVDLKFEWGRHCSVVSIAHCAVDRGIWLALPYTQRIAYLYVYMH